MPIAFDRDVSPLLQISTLILPLLNKRRHDASLQFLCSSNRESNSSNRLQANLLVEW